MFKLILLSYIEGYLSLNEVNFAYLKFKINSKILKLKTKLSREATFKNTLKVFIQKTL